MRIVIHDFVGHAFPVQLSRELAARGHHILHLYFPEFQAPKGPLEPSPGDPATFHIKPVSIGRPYDKYSPLRRLGNDRLYVNECCRIIKEFKPDAVLSGCATPVAQNWMRHSCQKAGIRFIAWVQDLYGPGVRAVLSRKLGRSGAALGSIFTHLDESLIRGSDGVVFISEEFENSFSKVRPRSRGAWHVIENWAPLDGLPGRPKVNAWSQANGLAEKRVLLYSGTLGLKHNPELLAQLAHRFKAEKDVLVVVVSEGRGRTYLERRKKEMNLSNLRLLDFQSFDVLPEVIAAGDVLLAIIEKDASSYSAPSKVLTYLCASRPLLLSVPSSNLSARIVSDNQAGIVVQPDDTEGFLKAADELMNSPDRAAALAAHGRQYAMATFQIGMIGTKFEDVFAQALRA
jgi:glycosyltransferase involved in cell wall biosynthesis